MWYEKPNGYLIISAEHDNQLAKVNLTFIFIKINKLWGK